MPFFLPSLISTFTLPSVAILPAFLAAAAIPFSRRYSTAASTSLLFSSSAFLQSITPAPVRSRSSLISFIFAIYIPPYSVEKGVSKKGVLLTTPFLFNPLHHPVLLQALRPHLAHFLPYL